VTDATANDDPVASAAWDDVCTLEVAGGEGKRFELLMRDDTDPVGKRVPT